MDSGAHFHKCDLQVHTPRDLNWQGAGATSEDERKAYAAEFVAACRARKLQAVGITDHHDVAFIRYIREAAAQETDEQGKPLPDLEQLVVFPGMELTLGIPCQALLLFDSDLPTEFLPLALPALGITPADDAAEKHAQIKKLDIMSFQDLYSALDKIEPLRGRFIAFPNVDDQGYQSLIRKGFEKHYADMPCVGGYVDGLLPVPPKGDGMRRITGGQDKNWGNKAIGVFQTSDCRSRALETLGTHATWIKWARPTAEALRQACLASHSRITHSAPTVPPVQITRVEVTNSKFLGPITLDFNPQYNAIIGGRGTGKSTILEYIRWALCDQPVQADDPAELADYERRRQGLIDGTLLPLDAVVDVVFLLNGVSHTVRRKASGELTLRIGDAAFQGCTEKDVRELLPIRAYSQKQLSAVGARLDELRRFVHAPIQPELDAASEGIDNVAVNLRGAFERLVRHRELSAEISAHDIERRSLGEQVAHLRATLAGLPEADAAIIDRQPSYEAEQRAIQTLEREAAAAKTALQSAQAELSRVPSPLAQNESANKALVEGAHEAFGQWVRQAKDRIDALVLELATPAAGSSLKQYVELLGQWRQRRDAHRVEYDDAASRASVHEETLRGIQGLEGRLADLNALADQKSDDLKRLGDPNAEVLRLRAEWRDAHANRATLLEKQCSALTSIAGSRLKASLRRSGDTEPLAEKLKQVMKGTTIRGDRIDSLVESLGSASNPFGAWQDVLSELLELAWVHVEEEATAQLPSVPRLDAAGFTQKAKVAMARQLEPDAWVDLLLFDVKDLPVFEYMVRPGDFLPFADASPGQQATALLSILLLEGGPPLLVDQPEDDLNMRVINEIVTTLWQAKIQRQIIFSSHNANLVVNGDAELVTCCDYRTSATEHGGRIKLMGAIDVPMINREIAEVMEGGEAAFKLRYKKYGF